KDWRKIKLSKPAPDCKTCGEKNFEFLEAEEQEFSAVLCGRDAVQIAPPRPVTLDLAALGERLSSIGAVKSNEYLVRLTVDGNEITVFRDGRAIIHGTDEVAAARSLYAKYVGS
ncbi:MAG TPA: hypothetical protein VL325_02325, partial [Pyrinomonadaceae bacterium]|nr:hypothetical protein [Pyrinomonadaceae bacterium]